MLHFILGTAGTGKTTLLIEKIKQAANAGEPAILLVPEQYSFEAERLLYRALGPQKALGVEVLSFTRLCNAVFRRFGGLAGTAVTEAGKYMLMSVALEEMKDTLDVYRKSAVNTAFLETMVSACKEMKTAGITPHRLEELADNCEESSLGGKLDELSRIYGSYQGLMERGYIDPDDDLIRAIKILEEHNFFENIHVFVDGFTTFMAAEFLLLEKIILQAKQVVFSFTADGLHDFQKGTGVFSPAKEAATRLIRYANTHSVKVGTPVVLDEAKRYTGEALAYLARTLFQPSPHSWNGSKKDAGVELLKAPDIYREMEYVAASIAHLVREEGYRYREIAVVARDTEPYLRAVQTAFERYQIPYFADNREEVENLPLVSGILAALDAVRSNFDSDAVITFAKSPLGGFDLEAVAALENYCYSWGVRGAVWTAPFANNPRGLTDKLTDADIALLDGINQMRELVISPLLLLKEALYSANSKRFAKGVYEFLIQLDAPEHLNDHAQKMPQGERESFLDQNAQLWDILMEILDIFGTVLGGATIKPGRMCELFRLAVGTAEVAQIPQTLDQVLVGMADRIRPGTTRAVFVIGANEGIFPAQIGAKGLFTDQERQQMIDMGAELSAPTIKQSVLERYFAYFSLTLASENLTVSYCSSDLSGREMQPSVIVTQLKTIFPMLTAGKPDEKILLSGQKAALESLAALHRVDIPKTAALRAYLEESGSGKLVRYLEGLADIQVHHLNNHDMAGRLFGRSMYLSPSRVERYYRCPFSYFAADGLSLKKRRKVEFTPLESGSVIHNVLQVMVQRHGGKGLAERDEKELAAEVSQVISEYLQQRVENMDALPTRFRYLFNRLADMLARLLLRIGKEFAQSQFEPAFFEMPISRKDGVEPLQLQTVEGTSVLVEGVVDRVDIMEKKGRRYVRVVDYKSGGKDFKLHDILYGLNLQMLLYLFTIQENGKNELAGAVPAGVLYMPVREKFSTNSRSTTDEEIAKEKLKQWKMNGLLLEDEEVLRGMEQDVAGIFIPAKLGKNGMPDARSSVASYAEMGRLATKVKELIISMAQALQDGDIGAVPVTGSDFDTCAFCDYRQVCGFEEGDPIREVGKIDKAQFFKLLEEESNGGA